MVRARLRESSQLVLEILAFRYQIAVLRRTGTVASGSAYPIGCNRYDVITLKTPLHRGWVLIGNYGLKATKH